MLAQWWFLILMATSLYTLLGTIIPGQWGGLILGSGITATIAICEAWEASDKKRLRRERPGDDIIEGVH